MNLTEYPESVTNLLLGQKRKKGRPLNNTAALIMQPSEAYSQAASSTARKSNSSSSSTEPSLASPKHKKHKKNEKSSQSLNPPHRPNCGEKYLRKKVFIIKINVIRNNFFENFEIEKMLKLYKKLFLKFDPRCSKFDPHLKI